MNDLLDEGCARSRDKLILDSGMGSPTIDEIRIQLEVGFDAGLNGSPRLGCYWVSPDVANLLPSFK
jgi:hypothetical protein